MRYVVSLLLCSFFLLCIETNGFSSSSTYNPLIIIEEISPEVNDIKGVLIGGYGKDGWKKLTDLPLKVDGVSINFQECPSEEINANKVETPLLGLEKKLVIYSFDGENLGSTKANSLEHGCLEVSGQHLIEISLDNKDSAIKEIAAAKVFFALAEGEKPVFVSTKREDNPGKSITFSAPAGEYGSAVNIHYAKIEKDGQALFEGTLTRDGKTVPFGFAIAEAEKDIKGFFIDFQADKNLDFILFVEGPGGGINIYSLNGSQPEKAVISIDLGD